MNENSIWFYKELVSPFNQSKIIAHKDKLIELKNSKIVAPVCCEIDLTDGFCNNKCQHCFFGTNNKNAPILIDTNRLKEILKELKEIGVKAVEFSGGGEPTTHPDIVEIIKYANHLGFDIGIVTNGYLLDKLVGCYDMFKFIRISVDAATSETYYLNHGVDYFDTVINNLKKVVESGNGYKLGVGYLITGKNNNDILKAAQLYKTIGCRFLQFRPASMENEIPKEIMMEAKKLVNQAVLESSENYQVFDAGIKWDHIFGERKYKKCTTSCLVSIIKANGDIPMCVLKRNDKDTILGNIYQQSFKDIFFSKLHEKVIDENDVNKCRKPCKHDSYNIMEESMNKDYLHSNFI